MYGVDYALVRRADDFEKLDKIPSSCDNTAERSESKLNQQLSVAGTNL
jgi:hypothetical protein